MREKFPMMAATAMIGTASFGPNCQTRTGTSMIEDPVPIMPLTAPAMSPTAKTKTNSNPGLVLRCERSEPSKDGHGARPRPSRRVLRTLLRVRAILIPQFESLDLPRRGLRQALHEVDPARIFPHPDLLLHVLLQRLAQRLVAPRAVLQRHIRFRPQQAVIVFLRHHGGFQHRWVRDQCGLHIEWRDP